MGAKIERKENELLREILGAIHHLKKESERIMSVLSSLQAAVAAVQTAVANESSAVLAAIADIGSLSVSDAQLVPLTSALITAAASTQANADALNKAVGAIVGPPGTSLTLDPIKNVSIVLATAPGVAAVPLTGITSTAPSPSITVLAVASDGGNVIATPDVSYSSPSSSGSLTFTPVAAGTSTVTVTVNDGVGSAVQTFTVTVS